MLLETLKTLRQFRRKTRPGNKKDQEKETRKATDNATSLNEKSACIPTGIQTNECLQSRFRTQSGEPTRRPSKSAWSTVSVAVVSTPCIRKSTWRTAPPENPKPDCLQPLRSKGSTMKKKHARCLDPSKPMHPCGKQKQTEHAKRYLNETSENASTYYKQRY